MVQRFQWFSYQPYTGIGNLYIRTWEAKRLPTYLSLKLRDVSAKTINKLNPQFMWDLLEIKDTEHDLRVKNLLKLPTTKTKTHGLKSFTFRGSIMWNYLPNDLKNCKSLKIFKNKIKSWRGDKSMCKLCV